VTLLLGIIAGTYSSVFIASQILVAWEDGDFERIWRPVSSCAACNRRQNRPDALAPPLVRTELQLCPPTPRRRTSSG